MNEQMAAWVLDACAAHGIRAGRDGNVVRAPDGLDIECRVTERPDRRDPAQVQVDFALQSPRLEGLPLTDSYAGFGRTAAEAARKAFEKFLQGSFPVVVESLTTHDCDASQVEREEWSGAAGAWRVTSGLLVTVATRAGARIEGFTDFFASLHELLRARLPPGAHWVRVFLGSLDGERAGGEILVDGGNWSEGEELLDAHPWAFPQGYASLRHLLIALPAG